MFCCLYFPGDTIYLSDIDMIAGTPVLDIKPYIPEYDSPNTRKDMGSVSHDSNIVQSQATVVSLNKKSDILNLQNSETDSESDIKSRSHDDDDDGSGGLLSRDTSEADIPDTDSPRVSDQLFLPKHLHSVLEDVKSYVTQGDHYQVGSKSKDQVSDTSKTKSSELMVERPCYGQEAHSTIAGWIKEPPVGNLKVRFTPYAERELAQFLPTHLSGRPDVQYAL